MEFLTFRSLSFSIFHLQPDALYKMCFGTGIETDRSWTTFCGSMIARNLESIWNSLRLARLEPVVLPTSDFLGVGIQERSYNMFSLEHLKFCFGRQFYHWHQGTPVVWYTSGSTLRKEVGTACLCTISPHRIRAVAATEDTVRKRLARYKMGNTKDNFWQCLNALHDGYNLSVMILCRVLCHSVVTQYNVGNKPKASQQSIYYAMTGIYIGDDNTLDLIYGDKVKVENYIKNHLTKRVMAKLKFFSNEPENNFFNLREGDAFKCAIVAGMRPLNVAAVKSLFDRNEGNNIRGDPQVTTDFFNTTSTGMITLNNLLSTPGFNNLGQALKHACEYDLLTQGLFSKILECRVQYNHNRHVYHQSLTSGSPAQIRTNAEANTVMFRNANMYVNKRLTGM